MVGIVGVVGGLFRVIPGIDHHHAHCDAPRSIGGLDRQRECAWFQCQRGRSGNGVHASGKFTVDVILVIGEHAALEIVVAVGRRERNPCLQRRPQKSGEGVAHFLPGLFDQCVHGGAVDGLRP